MQKTSDPAARFKAQAPVDENRLFQVPTTELADLTSKKFYRYFLTQNMPLKIADGANHWPAIGKWTDDYLN